MSTEGGAVFTFSLTGGAVCPLAPRQLRYCVLLYCCACLYHSLVVVQPSLTTVPCPTTKFTLIISKSFVGIKQRMISVALKTPLKTRLGMCIYKIHFRIGPMTILVLHQAVPPTFYNKIVPMNVTTVVACIFIYCCVMLCVSALANLSTPLSRRGAFLYNEDISALMFCAFLLRNSQ